LVVCKHPLVNEEYADHLVNGEYRTASATRNDQTQCGLEGRLWETKVIDDSMRPRSGKEIKPKLFQRIWRFFDS
jgi:hypothetical protein